MKNKIENIKTFVLWLLFISSIALVVIRYNLIQYNTLSTNKIVSMNNKDYQTYIIPKHINIKSGKYDMTSILKNKDEVYKKISILLINAFSSSNQIKKIDPAEYNSNINDKNITLIYDNIPAYYLEKSLNIKSPNLSNIDFLKELVILKDSIYIKTITNYHKISLSNPLNINIVDDIAKNENIKFYTKFENFNTDKNLLLPLNFNMTLSNINLSNNTKINDMAKHIFDDKLDFTSSMIQSDGVYFYSYNNGTEILKISNVGLLEYKKELSETNKDDIKKSTEAMLDFLMKIGIRNNDIIISNVEKINNSFGIIYKFDIQRQKNGIFVSMLENEKLENINVSYDTVIAANLSLKNIGDYTSEYFSIIDPSKAINDNIEHIKKEIKEKDISVIISKIDDISLIYKNHNEMLIPMWKYTLGEDIFFIDATNGELYNYAMEKN